MEPEVHRMFESLSVDILLVRFVILLFHQIISHESYKLLYLFNYVYIIF